MFRTDLKTRAKESMALSRPHAILVTLIYGIISGSINIVLQWDSDSYYDMLESAVSGSADVLDLGTAWLLIPLLMIAFNLLLSVVQAGYAKYCILVSRNQPAGIGTLFSLIRHLPRFIGLNLLMGLIMFGVVVVPVIIATVLSIVISPALILLAFVAMIPLVYFTFAYSQAIFFAVDDLGMSVTDCLRESRRIMQGRKWEYFVLELSFFPWALLVLFTFGLALIWLAPYMNITFANYFNHLVDYRHPAETAENPAPDDWYNQ